jgi:hypothetical protein
MNSTTKFIFVTLALGSLATPPTYADYAECPMPEQNKAHALLGKAEADEKAGKNREAYKFATGEGAGCVSLANQKRVEGLLSRASRKLGDEADKKGQHSDAFDYYYRGKHKLEGERSKMKLAKAKSSDVNTVGGVMGFFKTTKDTLSNAHSDEPNRQARLSAIEGYQKELRVIAKANGDKAMADEEKTFTTRKSMGGGGKGSLDELNRAKNWFRLTGQERQANERAEKRGDSLITDDARSSLELAISYYEFAEKDKKVQKVKDKARGLGDAHAKKGEKKLAADYYTIAGLDSKAEKLAESHEAEKEKAEVKRQDKFKKDQKSLEKELGL